MTDLDFDPLVKKATADAILERAASGLRQLMVELATALDPFPNFLGMATLRAVEVEPSGVANPDKGCIVVCADGQLYDLVLRVLPASMDVGGIDQTDELTEVDLSPGDFVAYAHAAVTELARILEEKWQ